MTDTNVFQLSQSGTFADPLTEVLRNGAPLMARARRGRSCGLAQLPCRQADRRRSPGGLCDTIAYEIGLPQSLATLAEIAVLFVRNWRPCRLVPIAPMRCNESAGPMMS